MFDFIIKTLNLYVISPLVRFPFEFILGPLHRIFKLHFEPNREVHFIQVCGRHMLQLPDFSDVQISCDYLHSLFCESSQSEEASEL